MRLIIDMDDVLADFVGEVLFLWNQRKGTDFKVSEVDAWNIEKDLGPGALEFMVSLWNKPGFFLTLPAIPGAVDGVKRLLYTGHDVCIATATPVDSRFAFDDKKDWLRLNMPWFDQKNFFSMARKDLLDADFLLDDGLHNLTAWADKKPGAVAFGQYWNRAVPATKHHIFRVEGPDRWRDFTDMVDDAMASRQRRVA